MPLSLVRAAVVLGLLSCVGPFAIDMYLPAMPAIAGDLGASPAAVQATVLAFFVAFGLAQMVYGPWADRSGRKRPIYVGVAIFLAASLACAVSRSAEALILWRFVQGLGAAVVMVVPRAVIRDLYTGTEATRLMALVMLVISVSPMLAPLAGSGVLALSGWRAIFAVLAIAAVASLILTATLLPETLRPEDRVPVDPRNLARGARVLMTDPGFLGLTFVGGFGLASFFVFITQASFVYTGQFGLSPTGFSLAFAVNAAGFFASSQLAAGLGARFGARRVVAVAATGFALVALATFALVAAGFGSLPVVIGGLFAGNAFLGLVIPTAMVLALDDHGDRAGLASSIGGTLQMLAGGLASGLAGLVFDGTVLPMMGAIAVCAALAAALALAMVARGADGAVAATRLRP